MWKDNTIQDSFGQAKSVYTYLLIIPAHEKGVLERVIINALNEYDESNQSNVIIIELKQWVINVLVHAVMVSFYRIQAELSDLRQPMIHVIFGHSPEYSTVFGGIFLILHRPPPGSYPQGSLSYPCMWERIQGQNESSKAFHAHSDVTYIS